MVTRRRLIGVSVGFLALIAAIGVVYATQVAFDRSITATWTVLISGDEPIQVYEADGVTPVTEIDFGVSFMDFFGNISAPTHPVVVKNHSATHVRVVVTGDMADDVLPLFGHGSGDLSEAPSNAFTLQPQGQSGDSIEGLVGLRLLRATTGDKVATIIFRATEASAEAGPSRIAFSSNRDGNYEIYVMETGGSNQTRLTNNSSSDWGPVWSPDGSRIAFFSSGDLNEEVFVMNADGSNRVNLTNNPADDGWPDWSPDGRKIAFRSNRAWDFNSDDSDIYVMDADGSRITRLTTGGARNSSPTWSPDGSKIAFSSFRDGRQEIYVMDADGLNVTRLTDGRDDADSPEWSPDGSKIAFSANYYRIYVMDADGSNRSALADNPSFNEQHPAWSPDGSKVAFTYGGGSDLEVSVLEADGSSQTNLTNNPAYDSAPDWSPGFVP